MLQTEDDLLHGQMPFADHTGSVEQNEASYQPQNQMPVVGVFAAHLTGLNCQQMLQGPKDKLNPTAPPPSSDQLRSAPFSLQTQQIYGATRENSHCLGYSCRAEGVEASPDRYAICGPHTLCWRCRE